MSTPSTENGIDQPTDSAAKVGFGLGIAALVMAFLPWITFATWLVAIPAIVVSVIGMVRSSDRMKPILGLVFAIVGWGVSLFAIFVTAAWLDSDGLSGLQGGDEPTSLSQDYPVPETSNQDPISPKWPSIVPISLEGSGDDVVVLDKPVSLAAMEVSANEAGRFFSLKPILLSGETASSLISTVDPFNGTVLLSGNDFDSVAGFEISAIGSWALTIKSIAEVPSIAPGMTLEGSGDALVRIEVTEGLRTLAVTGNEAERFFSVRQHDEKSSRSLIRAIDSYSGTVRIDSDTSLIEISAIGPWTISLN